MAPRTISRTSRRSRVEVISVEICWMMRTSFVRFARSRFRRSIVSWFRAICSRRADTTSDRGRNRFRAALLVAEVAATFVLLVVTGLLVSSFARLRAVEPGFRPEGVFVGFVAIPAERYPWRADVTVAFYSRLYQRLQEIPGAKQVALSDNPPPLPEAAAPAATPPAAEGAPAAPDGAQPGPEGKTQPVPENPQPAP